MSLYALSNGLLKGNYCYIKQDSRIYVEGKISGSALRITEFIDGKPNGYFNGSITVREINSYTLDTVLSYVGNWEDITGAKSYPFDLLISQSHIKAPYENKYFDNLDGTTIGIEGFMKNVKTAIAAGNRKWLADNTMYPIRVKVNGKAVAIKSKQELEKNFDAIFTVELKGKIMPDASINLWVNGNGAMLGGGAIWINNKAGVKPAAYHIIAINN